MGSVPRCAHFPGRFFYIVVDFCGCFFGRRLPAPLASKSVFFASPRDTIANSIEFRHSCAGFECAYTSYMNKLSALIFFFIGCNSCTLENNTARMHIQSLLISYSMGVQPSAIAIYQVTSQEFHRLERLISRSRFRDSGNPHMPRL